MTITGISDERLQQYIDGFPVGRVTPKPEAVEFWMMAKELLWLRDERRHAKTEAARDRQAARRMYACAALTGLVGVDDVTTPRVIASDSWEQADAMLKAEGEGVD